MKRIYLIYLALWLPYFVYGNAAQPNSLNSIQASEDFKSQLEEAIGTEAPAMILVSDNVHLRVGVYVGGQPERTGLDSYLLVDVFDSTNGIVDKDTPQGLFTIYSDRMRAKDYSRTFKTPLL